MAEIKSEIVSIIMGLSATQSNRQIQQTLSTQGIKLSHVTIGKIVRENRKERAEATKETINEHIKQTVTTDLDILQNTRDKLYEWFNDDSHRISERLMCLDRLNKVIDTRLKYSGAEEKEDKEMIIKWGESNE